LYNTVLGITWKYRNVMGGHILDATMECNTKNEIKEKEKYRV